MAVDLSEFAQKLLRAFVEQPRQHQTDLDDQIAAPAVARRQSALAQAEALRPDVILTQSQCEVCAVSLREVEEAVVEWAGGRPRIISVSPGSLPDVWSDMLQLAEALELRGRGVELVSQLKARVACLRERARNLPCRSVACIEWLDPLMAAGNWVPELVELAGGLDLFGESGKHSPWLNWEAVCEHDPEVMVILPCGFDIARTRVELPALRNRPDWAKLRAVRTGQVFLIDGKQYFNRPGPRLVESLEILGEILHPEIFHFGHHGTGWQQAHLTF